MSNLVARGHTETRQTHRNELATYRSRRQSSPHSSPQTAALNIPSGIQWRGNRRCTGRSAGGYDFVCPLRGCLLDRPPRAAERPRHWRHLKKEVSLSVSTNQQSIITKENNANWHYDSTGTGVMQWEPPKRIAPERHFGTAFEKGRDQARRGVESTGHM